MKTFIHLTGLASVAASWLLTSTAYADYTVHEWGTFTSVQGGSGDLLPWRSLQNSELPAFVHNWKQPGLNRTPAGTSVFGKNVITLQRMETPVIYFYSDQAMNADVSVGFPKGTITEWYPQATQIGPSLPFSTNGTSATLASRVTWKNLHLVPVSTKPGELPVQLPQDKSGSHYFTARATGSDIVQARIEGQGDAVIEADKFLFYRGVGNFRTPLRVKMGTNDSVSVENTGTEALAGLFLINVHDDGHGKTAAFTAVKGLSASDSVPCPRLEPATFHPLKKFQADIGAQMEAALVTEGLFPDEAKAMVDTWKDSWFSETGDRVLYLLPQAWTDETLPMTLIPKPAKLVRVMVGRAEIITPQTEMELSRNLERAANGDAAMRAEAAQEIHALGRFALPALQLANAHASSTNSIALGYQLLFQAEAAGSNIEGLE